MLSRFSPFLLIFASCFTRLPCCRARRAARMRRALRADAIYTLRHARRCRHVEDYALFYAATPRVERALRCRRHADTPPRCRYCPPSFASFALRAAGYAAKRRSACLLLHYITRERYCCRYAMSIFHIAIYFADICRSG